MFVGEAPGEEEDKRGEPFVGRAGQLLTKIIEAIGLTREQVYIANVIKCRPPGNRNPEPDEVAACEPFLFRQIDAIQPRVIVPLGKFAAQCLLKTTDPITRLRGRDVRLSRRHADSDLSSRLSPPQPLRQARSVGGHEEGPLDLSQVRHVTARQRTDRVESQTRGSRRAVVSGRLVAVPGARARPADLSGSCRSADARARRARGGAARHAHAHRRRGRGRRQLDRSFELRDIREVLDDDAFVPADVVALTEWVSDYYLAGPGAALAAALPPHGLTARVDAFKTVRIAH